MHALQRYQRHMCYMVGGFLDMRWRINGGFYGELILPALDLFYDPPEHMLSTLFQRPLRRILAQSGKRRFPFFRSSSSFFLNSLKLVLILEHKIVLRYMDWGPPQGHL